MEIVGYNKWHFRTATVIFLFIGFLTVDGEPLDGYTLASKSVLQDTCKRRNSNFYLSRESLLQNTLLVRSSSYGDGHCPARKADEITI